MKDYEPFIKLYEVLYVVWDKGVFLELYKKVSNSTDRRSSMFEATTPGMIKRALSDALTPLCFTIDALYCW